MTDKKAELRSLMVDLFGSVAAFAREADLPPTTVYNVLNRGVEGASFEVVHKIYETLQIDWFATGIDGPLRSKLAVPVKHEMVDVPLFGSIAAGTPLDMGNPDDRPERSFPIPSQMMSAHPSSFLLQVEGESMNRKLPNGCYALIDPMRKDPVLDNHAYAVCVNGYDATIKRVRRLNNGFELVPDSTDPTYKPTLYDYGVEGTDTITIIGEVVWYTVPFDFEI